MLKFKIGTFTPATTIKIYDLFLVAGGGGGAGVILLIYK